MHLHLRRFSYSPTETEGVLIVPPLQPIYTLERAWRATSVYRAGIPSESCCPDGEYELVPFERSNGHKVWALRNPSLGVFVYPDDREHDWQRSAILIHSGNTTDHSQGCILPGRRRGVLKGKRAVLESGFRDGYAMNLLTGVLGEMSEGHTLTIMQTGGAVYV